ncbi:hypothetical protein [Streptomyces sp. NRRL F-2580]|uniref:hypothetical protein n=1 Tax=Streptomyces sp. NRRL F-2580 TaxID=1463841 RepID=UPI0004C6F404|nr:hypothetical protein [Streptomyces sp. NRRL F-2580]
MRKGSRAATALLALCCTAVAGLTGCGGPARDGYVAVGAAAPGPERGAGENVAPRGQVEFQQLGGPSAAGGSAASSGTSSSASAPAPGSGVPGGSTPGGAATTAPGGPAGAPAGPGRTPPAVGTPNAPDAPGTPSTPSTLPTSPGGPSTKPGTTPPAPPTTPAKLTLSAPTRAAAADRWCERVTVTFTNTGTTAARAGTVSFATHIIGALGIDWATITTTQPLPAPLAGGASNTQTYTVCVEAWRVPLGMHVDTRNVTATWS